MTQKHLITADDLHAYADDALDPERKALVEAHLAQDPAAARQVADYRALNLALSNALDPMLQEPPQPRAALPPAPAKRFSALAAMLLVGLILGGAAGWLGHGRIAPANNPEQEIAAHTLGAYAVYSPETRHPVEVFADQTDHLGAWMSARMGMAFIIPSLERHGLFLVGGRLMAANNTPAALLMYETKAGERVILYVRNDLEQTQQLSPPRFIRAGDGDVVSWVDGSRGFGVSGALSAEKLAEIAKSVHAQYHS